MGEEAQEKLMSTQEGNTRRSPEIDSQGLRESSWYGKRCFVLGNTWGELCRGCGPVFHCKLLK